VRIGVVALQVTVIQPQHALRSVSSIVSRV
jgi:hypothetical protein